MEIIKDITQITWNKTAITLGKFDGVHLGHQKLIKKIVDAGRNECISTVVTFDRFPSQVLMHQPVQSIVTEKEKEDILRQFGVKRYVLFPFDEKTASMEPEEFVEKILVNTMKAHEIYVGSDFRFGKGRKGDIGLLETLSKQYGFHFQAIQKQMFQGREVSSTRIRDCILQGNLKDANAMLGMPFCICAEVIHGNRLGRTIGVPTINQSFPEEKILPKPGVYCAKVSINGKSYVGVANVGRKPTVQETMNYGVETHLFQCNENLYGCHAKTELLHFVRPEQKFDSIASLTRQLKEDINAGREFFHEFSFECTKQ